jgi:hypothetical protein
MSQADLLVCSVSSYSVWAAALSSAPYIWFAPQMHRHEAGLGSVWGHEAMQAQAGSPTLAALAAPAGRAGRAYAMDAGAVLPVLLLEVLRGRAAQKCRHADLVRYGVTPLPADDAMVSR